MYEYGKIEDAKAGSILEFVGLTVDTVNIAFTTGELYIVAVKDPVGQDDYVYYNKGFKGSASIESDRWRLVKTKPGDEAKVGDSVICINSYLKHDKTPHENCTKGKIYCCDTKNAYINGYFPSDFLVLCETTPKVEDPSAGYGGDTDLLKYNDFEVGKTIIRSSRVNVQGLEHGYKTKLLNIRMNYKGVVLLTVKDSNGKLRKSCRTSSWQPYTLADQLKDIHGKNFDKLEGLHADFSEPFIYHNIGERGKTVEYTIPNSDIPLGPWRECSLQKFNDTYAFIGEPGIITIRNFCSAGKPRHCNTFQNQGENGCVGCNAYITEDESKAEEQKMSGTNKKNSDITIEILGEKFELCRKDTSAALRPKTDLEKKLPFCMIVYNASGMYEVTFYNKTKKGIMQRKQEYLQRPENLGKHVTLHKAFGEFTTNVPVVEVK